MQFIDLKAQQAGLRAKIDERIAQVLDHGNYIMGPEVAELEGALSAFCDASNSITCANGTDAIVLALRALGVGPGDVVIVPAFTFAATAEAVALVGATPAFVDVDLFDFNICVTAVQEMIEYFRKSELTLKAIISVDLFGLPANNLALRELAKDAQVSLIADAAQSFGASYQGGKVGTLGDITTTSFFPAKPLGCYGDGGAVFCEDDEVAATIKSLRVHGKGTEKYDNVRIGLNSRLDTIQAAILLEKLSVLAAEIEKRNRVAKIYSSGLEASFFTPVIPGNATCAWAQFTLRPRKGGRKAYLEALAERDIPSAVYYPKPLHQQTAYRNCPRPDAGLPNSEQLAEEVFSVPMHPYLADDEIAEVIEVLNAAVI